MNIIYQCCYTNTIETIGGKVSSAWKPVGCSSQLPADAMQTCIKIQNNNCPNRADMSDEQGEILNQYDIALDSNYVYVMHTQYGLLDRVGRPNMFSHAFILPLQEEVLKNPNRYVTINEKNFKSDIDDLSMDLQTIAYDTPLTIHGALQLLDMTKASYVSLIQCLYVKMSEKKVAKPIYIQYDGTHAHMMAILYLILHALPFYLRKKFRASSSDIGGGQAGKYLVFSTHAKSKPEYFIPATAENNVLTSRSIARIQNLRFITYAIEQDLDSYTYFSELEANAISFGDASASDRSLLKISHIMLYEQELEAFDQEQLLDYVDVCLFSNTEGNENMEYYLSTLLELLHQRNILLRASAEQQLAERIIKSKTNKFIHWGEQYLLDKFMHMQKEQAVAELAQYPIEIFDMLEHPLVTYSVSGKSIVKLYYHQKIAKVSQMLELEAISKRIRHLKDTSLNTDVRKKAICIFQQHLDDTKILSAYTQLLQVLRALHDDEQLHKAEREAKKGYWETFTFSKFTLENKVIYETLQDATIEISQLCNQFCELYEQRLTDETALYAVFAFYNACYHAQIAYEDCEYTFQLLLKQEKSDVFLDAWLQLLYDGAKTNITEKFVTSILTCRDAIQSGKIEEAYMLWSKIASSCIQEEIATMKDVSKLLIRICRKHDHYEIIPLDFWLLLGELTEDNAFFIFDQEEEQPQIVTADVNEVVFASERLKKEHMRVAANAYIKAKHSKSKVVKQWMAVLQRSEKDDHDHPLRKIQNMMKRVSKHKE